MDTIRKRADHSVAGQDDGSAQKLSSSIWEYTPLRQAEFLRNLFFARKFLLHRVTGLLYLLEYAAAFYLYFTDYPGFRKSPLIWMLPATGLFQSINAMYTFTFLPKKTKGFVFITIDPGYFSDKHTMNYPFLVENSFFAMLLLFQWLYYDDFFYGIIKNSFAIEIIFVFFPYVIRQIWPRTRFRDSLESTKSKTKQNQLFYTVAIYITKAFYIWAKHYIGKK